MVTKPPDGTPLGDSLRDYRKRQGLSLREVARRAGVNSGYLSQLERGAVAHPSPPLLARIAAGYALPVALLSEWAGYGETDSATLSPNQAAALRLLGDPTDAEVRALDAFVRAMRSNGAVT